MNQSTNSAAAAASGFSLIELLVTMALVGILAAFAVPSFQSLVAKNESRSIEQDFVRQLQKTQLNVMNNKALSGEIRPLDADWSNGWSVTERYSTAATSEIINNSFDREISSDDITFEQVSSTDLGRLSFNRSGQLAGQTANVRFLLCNSKQQRFGREVEIQRSGLIRVRDAAEDAC